MRPTELQFLDNRFANYQISKLHIVNPDLANFLIVAMFLLLVLLTHRRNSHREPHILSRSHTEQLKGLAIFFVVLGHLWGHVSQIGARIVLSGDAVAMFLILSGFGITISSKRRKMNFGSFFRRRFGRVLIPYWIATSVILALDYIILGEVLSLDSLLMTLIGANFRIELRHLDYVRWFVTFILIWYVVFWIIYTTFPARRLEHFLLLIALMCFPINYYFLDFGYHYFAFPVGCMLAIHRDRLEECFKMKRGLLLCMSLSGLSCAIAYKYLYGHIYDIWPDSLPTIILTCLGEGTGIVLCFSVIILTTHVGTKGLRSGLLVFLGRYSYEIFLLHGVFLVKYNPVIKDTHSLIVIPEFALFLVLIIMLALVLSKSSALFTHAATKA